MSFATVNSKIELIRVDDVQDRLQILDNVTVSYIHNHVHIYINFCIDITTAFQKSTMVINTNVAHPFVH